MKRAQVMDELGQSTAKIMQAASDKAKDKLNQSILELKKLKLEQESRAIALLEKNPQAINRILNLFKNLTSNKIELTEEVYSYIESNPDSSGMLSMVIELLSQTKIIPNTLPFKLLCNAATASGQISLSFNFFKTPKQIDLPIILLLFTFPEHSLELATLLISLQNHGYSIENIYKSLMQAPKENVGAVITLLDLVLTQGFFYTEFIGEALEMGDGVNSVIEGARRLASSNLLSAGYFDVAKSNPKNAVLFAKNIELLAPLDLIHVNSKQELTKLQVGEFAMYCLLQQLKWNDKLNASNLEVVLKYNEILKDRRVEAGFRELPILTNLEEDELDSILTWMDKSPSREAIDLIVGVLKRYQLGEQERKSPTPV